MERGGKGNEESRGTRGQEARERGRRGQAASFIVGQAYLAAAR